MALPNLYLLHYNGRDDNLGDQFIFRALVDALGNLGIVHLRGGVPRFIAHAPDAASASAPASSGQRSGGHLSSGQMSLGLRLAAATLGGGDVFTFFPPGGRTWTQPDEGAPDGAVPNGAVPNGAAPNGAGPGGAVAARATRGPVTRLIAAARKRGIDALAGRRVALGTSVIPAANHAWCRACDWIGVRDHESLTALRAAGLPRVEYFPDLAFLPATTAAPSPRSEAGGAAHPPRRGILASFRHAIPELRGASSRGTTGAHIGADTDRYASRVSDALGALLRQLPDEARRDARTFYQVDEDAAFARQLGHAHGLSFVPDRVALESFARVYGSAEIVISNRLHCLLMGASCGAVPIALTARAHTKVTALFETVGWQPLILAIDDERALPARFDAILRDLPRWRQLIAETFAEQRALGLALLAQRFGPAAPPAAR